MRTNDGKMEDSKIKIDSVKIVKCIKMYKTKTLHLISTTNLCVLKSLYVYIFQVVAFFFF